MPPTWRFPFAGAPAEEARDGAAGRGSTPFTFRLCISVKSQARRLVPHCQQCCFAIARTRVSWTRSSARDTVVGQGTSIAPQPRNFSFEKSTEIVHFTLQCSL